MIGERNGRFEITRQSINQGLKFMMLKKSFSDIILSEHGDMGDLRDLWGSAFHGKRKNSFQGGKFPLILALVTPSFIRFSMKSLIFAVVIAGALIPPKKGSRCKLTLLSAFLMLFRPFTR